MGDIPSGYEQFLNLRKYVLDALEKVDMSYGHKSYEGTFELLFSFPGYFDDGAKTELPNAVIINLHCYVLGPSRHYSWRGKNVSEAVERCKSDVERWIKEEQDACYD